MPDLDQTLSEWRQQMITAGIKNPEVLDELESHLCEDTQRRARSGADLDIAFQMAVEQLGEVRKLKTEFDRVENETRKYMKRGLIIAAGIIGILVGMAFVTPAVAQYQHEGAMKNGEPWLFLLGSLLTLAGCAVAVRGLKKSRA